MPTLAPIAPVSILDSTMHRPHVNTFNEHFAFSRGQLIGLAVLSSTATLMAVYLFVRVYATPLPEAAPLPVVFSDDQVYTGTFVLDPNTAPADSLELLPGIGRVLADRIVTYRTTHRFKTEVDITEVKGINARLYEKIKPYLRVQR